MSLTRIQVEKILVKRASKRMIFVGLDGTTIDGSNEDLNDPISTALQRTGLSPADITNIADSDLTGVENVSKFLDLAELRLLENIRGNLDAVDLTIDGRTERYGQFVTDLEKSIKDKTKFIEREYNMGLGTLSAGVINLDSQQKRDDDFEEEL